MTTALLERYNPAPYPGVIDKHPEGRWESWGRVNHIRIFLKDGRIVQKTWRHTIHPHRGVPGSPGQRRYVFNLVHPSDEKGGVLLFVRKYDSKSDKGTVVFNKNFNPDNQEYYLAPIAGIDFRIKHLR